MHIYIYSYTYTHLHIFIHIYTSTHIHIHNTHIHIHIHIYTYSCTYTHLHIFIHIYTSTHIHTHIHIYTPLHTTAPRYIYIDINKLTIRVMPLTNRSARLLCQTTGATGSVLGLVGSVSPCYDLLKQQALFATSIPEWPQVKFTLEIRLWVKHTLRVVLELSNRETSVSTIFFFFFFFIFLGFTTFG